MINQRRFIRGQGMKAGIVPRYAGDGGCQIGTAVIGILAGNDQFFGWLPVGLEVIMGEPDRGIDGCRASRGEKHMVQAGGSDLRQLRGQRGCGYG